MQKYGTYREQDLEDNITGTYVHLGKVVDDLERLGNEVKELKDHGIRYGTGCRIENSIKEINLAIDRLNDFRLPERLNKFSLDELIEELKKD
jgi:hypothetical protein